MWLVLCSICYHQLQIKRFLMMRLDRLCNNHRSFDYWKKKYTFSWDWGGYVFRGHQQGFSSSLFITHKWVYDLRLKPTEAFFVNTCINQCHIITDISRFKTIRYALIWIWSENPCGNTVIKNSFSFSRVDYKKVFQIWDKNQNQHRNSD